MFGKAFSRIGIVALAATLLACATSQPQRQPQKFEVSLGGPAPCADGKLCAGAPGDGVYQHPAIGVVSTLKCTNPPACTEHEMVETETVENVKTTSGLDYLMLKGYGTTGAANEGLNVIACSADAVTETSASTAITNEITTNGFARHAGSYAHTAGQPTLTVTYTFIATGTQVVQKCALTNSTTPSGSVVTHILGFTSRTLQSGDQLAITFTITLSYDLQHIQQFGSFATLTISPLRIDISPAIVREPYLLDEEQLQLLAA